MFDKSGAHVLFLYDCVAIGCYCSVKSGQKSYSAVPMAASSVSHLCFLKAVIVLKMFLALLWFQLWGWQSLHFKIF
jgi:hypothetical protein